VTEIDIETVGMNVTVEGDGIDHAALLTAIESVGAVVNSVDQVVSGGCHVAGIRSPRLARLVAM
jgi:uncharacterized protein